MSTSEFQDLADRLCVQLTINRRFADIASKYTSFIINPTIIDYRADNLACGNFVSEKYFETRRRMVIEKKEDLRISCELVSAASKCGVLLSVETALPQGGGSKTSSSGNALINPLEGGCIGAIRM